MVKLSLFSLALAGLNVIAFSYFVAMSSVAVARCSARLYVTSSIGVALLVVSSSLPFLTRGLEAGTRNLILAAIVAVGPGLLGHVLMTRPLLVVPALHPTLARLAVPLVAGVLAWLFLGEPLTARQLITGLLGIGFTALALVGRSGDSRSRAGRPSHAGRPAP